jgi:hypothetical protein
MIGTLEVSDPPLCVELRRRWQLRAAINRIHSSRLDQIEHLAGFCGICGVGKRLDSGNSTAIDPGPGDKTLDHILGGNMTEDEMVEGDGDVGDEGVDTMDAITQFVSNID